MPERYDVIIRNGRVVDGTANTWFRADIAIRGGRIIRIGKLNKLKCIREIDAADKVVSPGFIDFHSHADFVVPNPKHLEILSPLLLQGITTLVTGNCGFSPVPVTDRYKDLLVKYTDAFSAEGLEWAWHSLSDYLNLIDKKGVGINIAQNIGHGALRNAVMGFEKRAATSTELKRLQRMLDQSLADGAYGLSIGLLYTPSTYAKLDEFIALGEVVASHDALFTAHLRGYSEQLLSCIRDFAAIGRQSGCKVHISHLHGLGKPNWHLIPDALALFDQLRQDGLDITFDIFGYIGGGSTITCLYPPWSLEGGTDKLVERLRLPETRERMRAEMEGEIMPNFNEPDAWLDNLVRNVGWENIYIISTVSQKNKSIEGMNLFQIARERNSTPFDVFADITEQENGNALFNYIGASGDLENDTGVQQMLGHPFGQLITDAILTGRGNPMPYAFNMFPRILGRYVRELKVLSLEEAVRKMTSASALRLGIKERGFLMENYWADITVFDPERIAGPASITEPDRRPEGIQHVLVNGHVVVEDGKVDTLTLKGKVLRRK